MLSVAVLETSLYKAIAGLQAPNDHEDGSGKLREALTPLEAEVGRLAQAIAGGGEIPALVREALTDWQGILRQETGPARRAMQALLQGRLMFTPQEGFYTFEGAGTISPVIAGAVGLQRVWCPNGTRSNLHNSSPRFHCTPIDGSMRGEESLPSMISSLIDGCAAQRCTAPRSVLQAARSLQ